MKFFPSLLLCFAVSTASAQSAPWPSQPVKLIVSQSAGGSIDIAARLLAQKLSDALGKAVVIDNRAGANGMIAAEAVMRATDGHTFLMTSPSALTINQHVYKKVPYDTLKDFVPVTQTTSIAFLLVVPANAPHKTAADLVAAAKAKPGAIKFASAGIGNQSQLAAELLAGAGGVNMLHVPYKGEAPALTDLIGGQTQATFNGLPSLVAQIKGGALVPLAVGSGARAASLPDVPTIAESGYPGFETSQWYGLMAPAGTPDAIVKRLQSELVIALKSPEGTKRMREDGALLVGDTPQEFTAFIAQERARWGEVVKKAKINVD